MTIFEVKINNINELSYLSRAYLEWDLKLNISKIARELKCDRKTVKKYLNGHTPKKTRNRIKYLDSYKDLMVIYLNDPKREFEYIDHLYSFMQREHNITCTRSTFYRFINDTNDIYRFFKKNKSNVFTQRFETPIGQQVHGQDITIENLLYNQQQKIY